MKYFISSESVTKGHPDKVADRISDAILDDALKQDGNSRVACEVAVKNNLVLVFGEITTNAKLNIEKIVRENIVEIGYDNDELNFNGHTVKILEEISQQSNEIAKGVDQLDQGAGDQGIMFGYATNETKTYMPLALDLAHRLAYRLTEVREKNIIKGLRPDGKTQVTTVYENDQVVGIDTIVVSTQHEENKDQKLLRKEIIEHVIKAVVKDDLLTNETKFLINPTGTFVLGGPAADSGLTGRKIIVDTYGGFSAHGGGAFSGKDPSKVDRSAAYMMRYLAKNIVASKIADKIEIQIAYAIGVANPISLHINTFGTEKVAKEKIVKIIKENFDLRPKAIIEKLNLTKVSYAKTSSYGHFGFNTEDYPWEKLDAIEIFKKLI